MKLYNFVKDEEEFLIENCNFTPDELKVFQLKQKDYTIVQIAMEMHTCERTINTLVNEITNKIIRTLIIKAIKNK